MSDFRIIGSVYRGLIEILQEAGWSPERIASRVGLPVENLSAPQDMLRLEQVTTLWELGFEARGARIGIDVAQRVRLVDFRDVGVFLTATHDVADLLKQLENYSGLFSNVVQLEARQTDAGLDIRLHYNASVSLVHERLDFLALAGPVLVSQYLASPLQLAHAELTRPRPDDTRPWDAAFGVKVRWDAPITRYVVGPEEARRPVLTRNEQLRKELQLLLDQRLRKDQGEHPLDEVRTEMMKQLVHQVPTVDSVASALHISDRTLQRRLTDGQSSFSDLLATLRKEMAQNYLRLGLATADIAERLGYADLPTFNRAFKRWVGLTPAQYLQSLPRDD